MLLGGCWASPHSPPLLGRPSPAVIILPPWRRGWKGGEHPPALTSQRGGEQEVGPILFDEAVGDLLGAGPASQQTDVADEFGGQGERQAEEVFPLQGQIIHLPASELPAGGERRWGEGSKPVQPRHGSTVPSVYLGAGDR